MASLDSLTAPKSIALQNEVLCIKKALIFKQLMQDFSHTSWINIEELHFSHIFIL